MVGTPDLGDDYRADRDGGGGSGAKDLVSWPQAILGVTQGAGNSLGRFLGLPALAGGRPPRTRHRLALAP